MAARSKGAPNRAQNGLGQPAWADRTGPVLAQFGPDFLLDYFSCDSPFVCTCMWAFDVISFAVKA
jgi:hypothetical protein